MKFAKINLSLSAKLWASALVSVFLMLGVGGFVWYSMSAATTSSEWVMKVIVPSVAVTKNISKQVESFEKFYLLALNNRNSSKKFEDAVANVDRAYDRLFGAFEMFEHTKNDAGAELRKVATAQWKEFSAGASVFRHALAEKKFDQAEMGLNDFIIPRLEKMSEVIVNVELINTNLIEKETENSTRVTKSMMMSKQILVFGLLMACLITLVFSAIFARSISKQINSVTVELKTQIGNTRSGIEMMTESASALRQMVKTSSGAVVGVSSAIDELSYTITANVTAAEQSSVAAKKSVDSINQGVQTFHSIRDLITSVQEANAQVTAAFQAVSKELGQIVNLTNNIGDKTKVINDIVFQTKLLSFNASVEAARAGEHGRGFSVVSEEIGKLASTSGVAAHEISDLLASSRSTIEKIVTESDRRMSEVLKDIEKRILGSTKAVEKGLVLMNDLVAETVQVDKMIQDINSSSKEQRATLTNISTSIDQLNQNTTSTEKESQSVDELVETMRTQASDIQTVVIRLETVVNGKAAA